MHIADHFNKVFGGSKFDCKWNEDEKMRCRRTESLRRVWLLTNAATKPPGCSVVHFWFIYLRYVLTLNRGTRDRNRAMFSAETVCEFNMVSAAACNTAYVDTVGFAEYCLLQYWPGRAVLCPIDRSVSKCTMNIYSQLYGVYFLTQWYFSEMLLSFIKIPCVYVAFHSLSEIFWQKKDTSSTTSSNFAHELPVARDSSLACVRSWHLHGPRASQLLNQRLRVVIVGRSGRVGGCQLWLTTLQFIALRHKRGAASVQAMVRGMTARRAVICTVTPWWSLSPGESSFGPHAVQRSHNQRRLGG